MPTLLRCAPLLLSLLCLATPPSAAQVPDTPPPPAPVVMETPYQPRMFYGGDVNLQFGNGFSIGGSPYVGWQFTRNLGVAVGLDYRYYTKDDYSSHSVGTRVFAHYDIIIPTLYAKAEFSYYWYNDYLNGNKVGSSTVPYLFLGGGYRQPIGKSVFMEAEVMFDVLRDANSVYDAWQPLFRVGVVAGI